MTTTDDIAADAAILHDEYRAGQCTCPTATSAHCGYHILAGVDGGDYERRYLAYRTMAIAANAADDYNLHADAETWALGGTATTA